MKRRHHGYPMPADERDEIASEFGEFGYRARLHANNRPPENGDFEG
jgi:hypothetical protein